ncbi:ABC transporter substrate-binding protein [Aquibium sp. A9E412]|uniref:ABC transporter substrate-binding protein n=1 Tax=Aquibium sp. A9E412 TaxID=2976767 RepID=UPI0025B168DA|nr:ABC transporter substrate-binding protein [Aquibium sp. A9E412]MDN2564855.1 ABC transporter substrate-binding protein [Aquibium sp. A9E412]
MKDNLTIDRRRLLQGAAAVPLLSLFGVPLMATGARADDAMLYGAGDPAAKRGGTLTVGSLIEPPSFDIYHQAGEAVNFVAPLMYQTLVYADHDGNPHPLLAESWEVSDDVTVYTFRLREGVTFHTGQPLEAADVKYSLDYMRDPENGTIGALDFADVAGVEAVDPRTVRVTLSKPNSAFLITLTHRNASVIPRDWFAGEGARAALNRQSVGTGPFKLAEFVQNSYMRLERNPDYWQPELPYLDEIVVNFIPNSAGMLVAVRNGRVDMAVLVRPQDAEQLEGVGNLTVQRSRSLNQKSLDLDSTYGPLSDERVRKAIALLVDKEAVMQAAISGYGQVLGTMVPGMQERWGVPLDELATQKVDVEQAKALLAEAGHPDGIDLELRTIIGYDWMEPAALALVQQLAQGGVRAQIQRLDLGTWLQNFRARQMGFTLNDWGTPPDPNILYYRHFHQRPEGADFRNWDNAEASRLLDAGRQAKAFEERKAIYAEFQKLLSESAPTVMMFGADHIVVVSDAVKNHAMHPIGWHFGLVKTWLDR